MKVLKTALAAFVVTLTMALLAPSAIQWALGALLLAGVMALALVGALLVIVVAAIYRNRQLAAVAPAPWPEEIAATDEPAPESVRSLRERNGKL
jgi:hypothetical protein